MAILTHEEVYKELSEVFESKTAEKLTEILLKIIEQGISHSRRLDRIEKIIEELAQAQKRTEIRVEELAQAQKKTEQEVAKLTIRVDNLTIQVDNLTIQVNNLTIQVNNLTKQMNNLSKQVGGLSQAVGYNLEDKIFPTLPRILREEFNFEKLYDLRRCNIEYNDGNYDEINIFGKGIRNGEEVIIVGECKINLSKRHIKKLEETSARVAEKYKKRIFKIIVTSHCQLEVEKLVKEKNIAFVYSFELENLKKYFD